MPRSRSKPPVQLEDLPNIGKAMAADLRSLGILTPAELAGRDPLATFAQLAAVMGHRHDPCVLYVLLAAKHFLDSGEPRPWWSFTAAGKELLAAEAARGRGTRKPV